MNSILRTLLCGAALACALRAQAVVAWLVAHDVADACLSAVGLERTKPVADNSTE